MTPHGASRHRFKTRRVPRLIQLPPQTRADDSSSRLEGAGSIKDQVIHARSKAAPTRSEAALTRSGAEPKRKQWSHSNRAKFRLLWSDLHTIAALRAVGLVDHAFTEEALTITAQQVDSICRTCGSHFRTEIPALLQEDTSSIEKAMYDQHSTASRESAGGLYIAPPFDTVQRHYRSSIIKSALRGNAFAGLKRATGESMCPATSATLMMADNAT